MQFEGYKEEYLGRWLRKNFAQRWEALLGECGYGENDILKAVGQRGADGADVVCMRMMASSRALLRLLVKWSSSLRPPNHLKARRLVDNLVDFFGGDMALSAAIPAPLARRRPVGSLHVLSEGGLVDIAAIKQSDGWLTIAPEVRKRFPTFDSLKVAVSDFCAKLSQGEKWSWLSGIVVDEAAKTMEVRWDDWEWSTDILSHTKMDLHTRHDPEVGRALRRRLLETGRAANRRRADAVCRELGVRTNPATYTLQMDMYQYWMASRRAFSDAAHVAMATDGARTGGRNRSNAVLMNLESGVCSWAPPQVSLCGFGVALVCVLGIAFGTIFRRCLWRVLRRSPAY